MKECYWCKKQCPLNEEGSYELDVKTEKEIGWICDHCVLAFEGKCECVECATSKKAADDALRKYDLVHPRMKYSSLATFLLVGCWTAVFAITLYLVFCHLGSS